MEGNRFAAASRPSRTVSVNQQGGHGGIGHHPEQLKHSRFTEGSLTRVEQTAGQGDSDPLPNEPGQPQRQDREDARNEKRVTAY